jgi:hypothetical protein
MATKQASIVNALTALIMSIPAIGVATPWKPTPFIVADCPGVYIADPRAEVEFLDNESQATTLDVMLLLFVVGGTVPSAVLELINSIYSKLRDNETLGGLVWTMVPAFHEIDLNQTGAVIAAAQMSLKITFDSERWDV